MLPKPKSWKLRLRQLKVWKAKVRRSNGAETQWCGTPINQTLNQLTNALTKQLTIKQLINQLTSWLIDLINEVIN